MPLKKLAVFYDFYYKYGKTINPQIVFATYIGYLQNLSNIVYYLSESRHGNKCAIFIYHSQTPILGYQE